MLYYCIKDTSKIAHSIIHEHKYTYVLKRSDSNDERRNGRVYSLCVGLKHTNDSPEVLQGVRNLITWVTTGTLSMTSLSDAETI